jgi:hypothetical protein
MKLIAERDGEVVELGDGFTFESAYDYIEAHDADYDWMEGFDLVLVDGEVRWLFEADCWVGWEHKNGEWISSTVNY